MSFFEYLKNQYHINSRRRKLTALQQTKLQYRCKEIEDNILEMIIYIFFLLIFSIIIYNRINTTSYYYNEVIRKNFFLPYSYAELESGPTEDEVEPKIMAQFKLPYVPKSTDYNENDVKSIDDFWDRIFGLFFNNNLKSFWFDLSENKSKVAEDNKLLGPVRFRQLRVGNLSCPIPQVFRKLYKNCYGAFSEATETQEPYRLKTKPGWFFSSKDSLEGNTWKAYMGDASEYYHGGGFSFNLQFDNESDTLKTLKSFTDNFWVDLQTRVVYIDFVVFNVNIHSLNVVKFLYEFLSTGHVKEKQGLQIVKLSRFDSSNDYVILAFELMLITFVSVFTLLLAKVLLESIMVHKFLFLKYFLSRFWNVYDLILLNLFFLYFYKKQLFDDFSTKKNLELHALKSKSEQYFNLESFALNDFHFDNFFGFLYFMAWFKLMKFVNFNRTISYFSLTLSKCTKHIFGFLLIFIIIFTAFCQFGYLMFGTYSERFRTYKTSVVTLLRAILNDFQYNDIERTNVIIGPIFFMLYIFIIFFVLMNMFLAIIDSAYLKTRSGFELQNRLEFKHFFKNIFSNIYGKLQSLICNIPEDRHLFISDKFVHDLKQSLKVCGFNDEEIDDFIDKGIENEKFRKPQRIITPLVDWDTYLRTLSRLQQRMKILHAKIRGQVKKDLDFLE